MKRGRILLSAFSIADSVGAWIPGSRKKYYPSHQLSVTSSSVAELTTERESSRVDYSSYELSIGKRIGSGSYGTVHVGHLTPKDGKGGEKISCIAKRAWSVDEIESDVPARIFDSERPKNKIANQGTGLASAAPDSQVVEELGDDEKKTRAKRCLHYFEVERHCFEKIEESDADLRATPAFLGVHKDQRSDDLEDIIDGYEKSGNEWMTFEFISSDEGSPAPTLLDAMELDWKDQHIGNKNHHLYDIQMAMKLDEDATFGDTLDAVFVSILEDLKQIHSLNIVHRDLKPGNLICDGANQRLRLIDLGSAADLDPSSPAKGGSVFGNFFSGEKRVGYDEGIVAISPVYCAPETFIKLNDNPLSFDIFSAGLIVMQLIFNLLDERTDVGFLQQVKSCNYDLDLWLEKELVTKLRPAGFDEGLEYLGERRGMFGLLKRMFEPNPLKRITASDALDKLVTILQLKNAEVDWDDDTIVQVAQDEAYFEEVIANFEAGCGFTFDDDIAADQANIPRPLHFLASFKKRVPVGLFLSEASEVEQDDMTADEWSQWQQATEASLPGEVFVKGWEDCSQADDLGLFEIGDRLRGVGELPFVDGGFEQAIKLINRQPKGGDTIKLHFDRRSSLKSRPSVPAVRKDSDSSLFQVTGQGAWKSGGRRGNQEDAFILHEIKTADQDVLLAGVFDGHAGTAASESCQRVLPSFFTVELSNSGADDIEGALERSWESTCDTYRNGCDENGECIVDYDPREGVLFAETGSENLVAGTTATVAAFGLSSRGTGEMTVLNCGDSRTLVIGEPQSARESFVVFETRDHSPDDEVEIERLKRGQEEGLDYSIPMCSASGSFMVVGDFQYALARSLEGSFVTDKGITSEADVTRIDLVNSMADRDDCAVVLACDGLFEVMSNEEVGREVVRMRRAGYNAGDIAKNLCGQALKKGSYDNLSVVVIYLDRV